MKTSGQISTSGSPERSGRRAPSALAVALATALAVSLISAGLGLSSSSGAQVGDSVPDDEVAGTDTPVLAKANQDKIDSIREKQQKMVDDTCAAMAEAFDLPGLPLSEEQKLGSIDRCDVAKRNAKDVSDEEIQATAVKRHVKVEGFAEYTGPNRDVAEEGEEEPGWEPGAPTLEGSNYLGKKYVVDGDGDGICNQKGGGPKDAAPDVEASQAGKHGSMLTGYDEWCAEVVGDGIGDDDGFCEHQNPKGKEKSFDEPCVPAELSIEDLDGNEENFDSRKLDDLEIMMTSGEGLAQQFRAATTAVVSAYREDRASVSASSGDSSCNAVEDRLGEEGIIALGIASTLGDLLEGVASTIQQVTGQTVVAAGFGANSQTVAAIAFGAVAAIKPVATGLELTADVDTATNVNSTLECVAGVGEKVDGLAAIDLEVTELQEKARYLVSATFSGRPISGINLAAVKVASKGGLDFQDLAPDQFTTRELDGAPGAYELTLNLPQALKNSDLFIVDVEGDPPADSAFTNQIFGHVLFDRSSQTL